MTTSGLDQSGVQQEHNFNAFLTEVGYIAILNRMLGEASVADLRMLLIDKLGANLRNTAAHGLALTSQLEDVPARYSGVLNLRFFLGGMHPAVDS